MNSFRPWSRIVSVLLLVFLSGNRLAAEHSIDAVQPLASSGEPEADLICDFDSLRLGTAGADSSQSNSRWLQYDNPEALLSPQRIRTVRLPSQASKDPDANRDGHLTGSELETLDQSSRLELLRRYDSNADGILSRYELPKQLPALEKEELKPERPSPQLATPAVRQPYQNLLRFGMPTTRQPTVRSNPFAQAATFGARVGSPRARFSGGTDPHCHSSCRSVLIHYFPVR